jgi:hypothetical protein
LKKLSPVDAPIVQDTLGLSASSVGPKKFQLKSLALKIISDDEDTFFGAMRASVDLSQLRDVSEYSKSSNAIWEATKDSTGSLEILTWNSDAGAGQYPLMIHIVQFC